MIKLRIFNKKDIDKLISWITDKELCFQFAGHQFSYPLTEQQLLSSIEKMNNDIYLKVYSVFSENGDELFGHVELRMDKNNNSGRVGKVIISEEYRNKGYGTQLIKEILKVGFVKYSLHRIDLVVFDFNKSAIRSYKNAGFKEEGLLRDSRKINNEYWSLLNMSILADEYNEKILNSQ